MSKYIDSINDIDDIIKNDDGTYTIKYHEYESKSGSRLVTASWKEVPHFNKRGRKLEPDEYKKQTIAKNGKKYFAQTEECEFLGSSDTLVSTESLKRLEIKEPIKQDSIINGIKIYEEPKINNHYIVSVDPAKDGLDSFAIQVINITKFPFVQAASAKLDVDYLMMPENLNELGHHYNEAFMIIENNEGAGQSIADMMYGEYEYENLYRDRDTQDKKYKKYPGFRTTVKSRSIILNMMRIFIEEDKIIINDKDTINELFNFIKKDGKKYEAEEGYHDDTVMALAISFAPFLQLKAYDDLGLFLRSLRLDLDDSQEGVAVEDFYSMLEGTGGFDDGTDDSVYDRSAMIDAIRNSIDIDTKMEYIDKLNRNNF